MASNLLQSDLDQKEADLLVHCSIPGIGFKYEQRLRELNMPKASDLYKKWMEEYERDDEKLKDFLRDEVKVTSNNLMSVIQIFNEYHRAFQEEC
ncbi:uncharacterized protein LOC141848946 isoform X2 [Brevipalpus obovatus]